MEDQIVAFEAENNTSWAQGLRLIRDRSVRRLLQFSEAVDGGNQPDLVAITLPNHGCWWTDHNFIGNATLHPMKRVKRACTIPLHASDSKEAG